MPHYVEWTRAKTGRRINTHTIDREICEWWQVPVKKDQFNEYYDSVSLCAIGCLMRYGGSQVTDLYLNAYLEITLSGDYPETPQFMSFCREFLLHRYSVRCWYSPR